MFQNQIASSACCRHNCRSNCDVSSIARVAGAQTRRRSSRASGCCWLVQTVSLTEKFSNFQWNVCFFFVNICFFELEQIALWAKERARVRCDSAALYTLPSLAVHRAAVDVARRADVFLYADESALQLIVAARNGRRVMTQFFASR